LLSFTYLLSTFHDERNHEYFKIVNISTLQFDNNFVDRNSTKVVEVQLFFLFGLTIA
jgi:hypothetical protein